MHNLKEKFMDEIYEYEEKAKKSPDSKFSPSELQTIHMLTDTVKNIDKIEMLEGDGHSEDRGRWGAVGSYESGRSMARGGGGRRDSYNREERSGESYRGESYRGGSYDDDMSYARRKRDRMGRYSRDSGKSDIMESLEEMMQSSSNERDKEAIRKFMDHLERM